MPGAQPLLTDHDAAEAYHLDLCGKDIFMRNHLHTAAEIATLKVSFEPTKAVSN